MESKYLYLFLMLFTVAFPLANSFEKRLNFYKKWKYLIPVFVAEWLVFITWDSWFTAKHIWWFNSKYVLGSFALHLPIEEWAFFWAVPFSCIFLYESVNYYIKIPFNFKISRFILFAYSLACFILAFVYFGRLYTTIVCLFAGILALILALKNPNWVGKFIALFLISWIPFLLINGILTGSFIAEAVVNYNPNHIIGYRIFTIPVEDSIYNFVLLVVAIGVYEWAKKRELPNI